VKNGHGEGSLAEAEVRVERERREHRLAKRRGAEPEERRVNERLILVLPTQSPISWMYSS
jgi:hypothetical protein